MSAATYNLNPGRITRLRTPGNFLPITPRCGESLFDAAMRITGTTEQDFFSPTERRDPACRYCRSITEGQQCRNCGAPRT